MRTLLERGIDPWMETNADLTAQDIARKAPYNPTIYIDEYHGMLIFYNEFLRRFIGYREEDVDRGAIRRKIVRLREVERLWVVSSITSKGRRYKKI